MAVTVEQFIERLTQSGLMSAAEISAFQDSLPPDQRPRDVKALVAALYRAGKLTKYQAQAVYEGKTKGLVFGQYVVLDKLGEGGMGVVLKAQHRRMKRMVAIKILSSAAMKQPGAVERFHREVKAAAKLAHPNIVTAYDADEHQGMHYLAMEYVEGQDLATIVKEHGPLDVKQAVECILQAARGLQYAHEQGHRPPRHQAGQPAVGQEGHGQDPRHGPGPDDAGAGRRPGGQGPDRHGPGDGHLRLHGARAGIRHHACRPPGRHLLPGLHALPAADRQARLRGRVADADAAGPSREPDPVALRGPARGARRVGRLFSADGGQAARGPAAVDGRGGRRVGSGAGRVVRPVASGGGEGRGVQCGLARSLAFLQEDTPRGVPARQKKPAAAERTQPSVGPERDTGSNLLGKALGALAGVRRKPLVLAGIAGGLVLLLGIVLAITLRHGTLVVEIDEELGKDVQVAVSQGGEQVQVADAKCGWTLSLARASTTWPSRAATISSSSTPRALRSRGAAR